MKPKQATQDCEEWYPDKFVDINMEDKEIENEKGSYSS